MATYWWCIALVCLLASALAAVCHTTKRDEEKVYGGSIKTAVLVISTSELRAFTNLDKLRYTREKHNWLGFLRTPPWVTAKLIECHPGAPKQSGAFWLPGSAVLKLPCSESFRPGIYAKSMKSLALAIRDPTITHFVRTNLSTYVMFDRLKLLLEQSDAKYGGEPYYLGPYCGNGFWVPGWGITMNRAAAELLLANGSSSTQMGDTKTPDDVLIGDVLKQTGVSCKKTREYAYWWNYKKSAGANIAAIKAHKNAVFIRLKLTPDNTMTNSKLEQYQAAIRALVAYSDAKL